MISILSQVYIEKVIVFFKTKKQCHRTAIILGLLGLNACELHGNLSQTQRIQAFLDFKEGKYEFMLATDLAARGLDITGLPYGNNLYLFKLFKFFQQVFVSLIK